MGAKIIDFFQFAIKNSYEDTDCVLKKRGYKIGSDISPESYNKERKRKIFIRTFLFCF